MNVEEVLDELGIDHVGPEHRHCNPGWAAIDCPWCGPESKKFHLGINVSGGFSTCWKCGYHNIVSALVLVSDRSLPEIKELLDHIVIRPIEPRKPKGKLKRPDKLCDVLAPHRKYLQRRGFDPEEIVKLWGIKCIGPETKLAWRIWIPIHLDWEIVSWTTRAIGDVERRYVNAPKNQEAIPIGSLLYGEDYCWHAVVIHEGPLDVWRTGPGSVATFGVNVTREQVLRLSKYPTRVICFDRDAAARRRARKLEDQLVGFPGVTFQVHLHSGDPGEATEEETAMLRGFLKVD